MNEYERRQTSWGGKVSQVSQPQEQKNRIIKIRRRRKKKEKMGLKNNRRSKRGKTTGIYSRRREKHKSRGMRCMGSEQVLKHAHLNHTKPAHERAAI